MITEELVRQAIDQIKDRNAYRIASWLSGQGYPYDMNFIRQVLGEAPVTLRDDGYPAYEPTGRSMRRSHQKKNAARHKGIPV